jgi:integrase/recombinase XerD
VAQSSVAAPNAVPGACLANGHLVTDPGARFRTPRLKRTIPILPAFHDLATQLASEPSPRNRAMLAIALYGGLRAALIAGLRRAHFVPDQGLIGFVGKGQKQRSVALPPQALEIIRLYLTSNGAGTNGTRGNGHGSHADAPLLCKEDGSGDGLSYLVINLVVTRWTRRPLGVRLTPHKLRHAYGKHCVNRGVDIRIIAEALGHESLESTKIYTLS